MSNLIFLNIIALELVLLWIFVNRFEEVVYFLINLIFNIQVSWLIFITSVLWIFHAGCKYYTIMYTKGGEDDEIYEIHFPPINLK